MRLFSCRESCAWRGRKTLPIQYLIIHIRNVEIETLANGKDIFYIDVNEAVCDENGNLYADWTFDQIHLKAKYYQVWENFLMEHGIVKK